MVALPFSIVALVSSYKTIQLEAAKVTDPALQAAYKAVLAAKYAAITAALAAYNASVAASVAALSAGL